jgi:hypothetical protein
VPYLEQWKAEAGINVLDGWTFQASDLLRQSCGYSRFIHSSHPSRWFIFPLESLPNRAISISASVYFKSPQMHGACVVAIIVSTPDLDQILTSSSATCTQTLWASSMCKY